MAKNFFDDNCNKVNLEDFIIGIIAFFILGFLIGGFYQLKKQDIKSNIKKECSIQDINIPPKNFPDNRNTVENLSKILVFVNNS